MPRYDLELFADYHQFYLQDEAAAGDLLDDWNDETVARMLAVGPGTVAIGTVRNMTVPVAIEILVAEPEADFDGFDHVVECSLAVAGERIVAYGCTDYLPDARRIDAPAGTYRVRASYANLDSLSFDGIEGDDRYRVQLWPAPPIEPRVLKQRTSGA